MVVQEKIELLFDAMVKTFCYEKEQLNELRYKLFNKYSSATDSEILSILVKIKFKRIHKKDIVDI